jgi:predicted Zn-dependent protease
MIEKNRLMTLLDDALSGSPADETELVGYGVASSLTRFAGSAIHQNVHEDDHLIIARVAVGKKIGVVQTNRYEPESLRGAIDRAVEIARQSPEVPGFPGLPRADSAPKVASFSRTTASMSPDDRAEGVGAAVALASESGVTLSGAFRTSVLSRAVANSSGTRQYYDATEAFLSVFATDENGVSGSSSAYAVSCDDVDPVKTARKAVDKCKAAADPIEFEADAIDVVLEPRATSEIMEWLNFTSFGAKQVQEGQSFMAGRIGEKVMGDNVTIYDDGLDPEGIPIPFDFEGVPKRRVAIVENGIAKGPVYDSLTAARDGAESTGHGGIATFRGGPMPSNLFIAAGEDSYEDLLLRVKRGLVITRFHYINGLLDTKKALFTGMTRDGTFLVEDGKIAHAIKNLRFTDSMLRAYSNVDGVTREREIAGRNWGGIGSVTAPTMLVRDFRFTGTTEF